jgi:hypothetical protein
MSNILHKIAAFGARRRVYGQTAGSATPPDRARRDALAPVAELDTLSLGMSEARA